MTHNRYLSRAAGPLATLLLALTAFAGCSDLTSPNVDNEDLSELTENPTPELVHAAVQGMLVTNSAYMGAPNGYVVMLGILGRTAYNLDIADPRFVTSTLQSQLNPAGGAFGGNFWSQPYSNLQAGERILTALENLPTNPDDGLTAAQKEGIRGFVKTFEALELLTIANTRDINCDGTLGCPVDVPADPADLAPAVTREAVYDEIVTLLEEARDHLSAGGGEFSFQLPLTFSGFDTPATFMEANWALEARVRVYRGSLGIGGAPAEEFQAALDALDNSFVDIDEPMDLGIANAYGAGSGDIQNSLFQPSSSPNARAHPSVVAQAEPGDARVAEKTREVDPREFQGVSSAVGFDMYGSLDAPIPIIRNEELILLRAEANIGLNQLGAADDDINFIRTEVADLPEKDIASMTQAEALEALLYEKRYSLLFEGGHYWIDTRRYGFDAPPSEGGLIFVDPAPNDVINSQFPIPINEQLARQ